MKKSVFELLAIINKYKNDGKTIDQIVEIMERKGLHADDTIELFALLK